MGWIERLQCKIYDHDDHIVKVWDEHMVRHFVSLGQCQRCGRQWWMRGEIFFPGAGKFAYDVYKNLEKLNENESDKDTEKDGKHLG